MNSSLFKTYFFLYTGIFVYSLTSVTSKVAASYPILSMPWVLYYMLGIVAMGIYAIIWQQVLKRISLITAYANRSITTFLGLVWGNLIFKENISARVLIGAIVIVVGVIIVTGAEYEW